MEKSAVPVVAFRDALHGNLKDLFEGYESPNNWQEQSMVDAFKGHLSNPLYRIPSADTGTELFFDDLDVLARFASMPLPAQQIFCKRVRAVMSEAGVERLHLTVQWVGKETTVLKIRLCAGGHLDICVSDKERE